MFQVCKLTNTTKNLVYFLIFSFFPDIQDKNNSSTSEGNVSFALHFTRVRTSSAVFSLKPTYNFWSFYLSGNTKHIFSSLHKTCSYFSFSPILPTVPAFPNYQIACNIADHCTGSQSINHSFTTLVNLLSFTFLYFLIASVPFFFFF